MKTTNFLKQMPFLLLISGALMFFSCENTNTTDRSTSRVQGQDTVGTTDQVASDVNELDEADYATRRERVTTNLEMETLRTREELERLRERANTSTGEAKEELYNEIRTSEKRLENLEAQQIRLDESNRGNWEETERGVEGALQDGNRSQKGAQNTDAKTTGSAMGAEAGQKTGTGTDIRTDDQSNDRRTDAQGDMNQPTDNIQTDIDRTDQAGSTTEENRNQNLEQPETGGASGNDQ